MGSLLALILPGGRGVFGLRGAQRLAQHSCERDVKKSLENGLWPHVALDGALVTLVKKYISRHPVPAATMRALAIALVASATTAARPRATTKGARHFLVRKSEGPPPDELPDDACRSTSSTARKSSRLSTQARTAARRAGFPMFAASHESKVIAGAPLIV